MCVIVILPNYILCIFLNCNVGMMCLESRNITLFIICCLRSILLEKIFFSQQRQHLLSFRSFSGNRACYKIGTELLSLSRFAYKPSFSTAAMNKNSVTFWPLLILRPLFSYLQPSTQIMRPSWALCPFWETNHFWQAIFQESKIGRSNL